ncbi:MAG: DUF2520 domain-containing protein [Pyrinomonadaceae bacterium]
MVTHRPRRPSSFVPRLSRDTVILPLARLAEAAEMVAPDILFITTPDDRIEESAQLLASVWTKSATKRATKSATKRATRVALHLSGALSSASLVPLRARGYSVGSMHPLVSLAGAGAEGLRRAHYCLEGETKAVRIAKRIVKALDGESFTIQSRHKALYHAAAVMSAGHLVALMDAAAEMLAACGFKKARAQSLLNSLAASALRNLASQSPEQALTGPFTRGDQRIIDLHLQAIADLGDGSSSNTQDIYLALARRQLRLAAKRGLDRAVVRLMADALNKWER